MHQDLDALERASHDQVLRRYFTLSLFEQRLQLLEHLGTMVVVRDRSAEIAAI